MSIILDKYKVSVIVPMYNAQAYLTKCVESLFAQTLTNFEIIFIDDCSADGTVSKLKKVLSDLANTEISTKVILNKSNLGVASTRNIGLDNAEGLYLAAVDPDDFIAPTMLEDMFQAAETANADIVWCDYVNVYADREDYISQKIAEDPLTCISDLLSGALFGGMCTKLVKRSLFLENQIRFPDGLNMSEDLRVCISLFYYAKTVKYVGKGLYFYTQFRDTSISISNNQQVKVNLQWFENIKGIESFLKSKNFQGVESNIMKLKLIAKQNLLVRGKELSAFLKWREVFPESNAFLDESDLPKHYKIIGNQILNNKFLIPRGWLFLKKVLGK